jgi:hypothetical protein
MDPTTCYHDMLLLMQEGKLRAAREHALNLQHWLNRGGFCPENQELTGVKGHLARVLRMTDPNSSTEPDVFSLVCSDCDNGSHILSESQAIEEGWTAIQPAPDLPMANYVGTCLQCDALLEE